MTICPVVMKHLYELSLSAGVMKEKTISVEIALADSRNLRSDFCSEFWTFKTDTICLQSINCSRCGNYKYASDKRLLQFRLGKTVQSYSFGALSKDGNALCSCNKSHPHNIQKMILYDQMGAFMDVEKDCDLLCEDVVGVILEYL